MASDVWQLRNIAIHIRSYNKLVISYWRTCLAKKIAHEDTRFKRPLFLHKMARPNYLLQR